MARTRQRIPGAINRFQRPKYEKPLRKTIRLPDCKLSDQTPDQTATEHSSTLVSKLPLEILHEILTLAFANELWSNATKAPFFRYVELKEALIASAEVSAVSREWHAVTRSIILAPRVRRDGVLLGIQVRDMPRTVQLFPGISGCVVFLGDPNNIPLLESNFDMLCQLSQNHRGALDFVSAVEWCIPSDAKRSYGLELPLRAACEEKCVEIFGSSELWQRRLDEEVLNYLIEELSEFMLWHTSLIVSFLEIFQSADYVDIPAFVFASTRDLNGDRALFPLSDGDRVSEDLEETSDAGSTFETSRVLAMMGKAPVPSHRRSCAFFADLVKRTRYLYITTFPNALQGLFAWGYLPNDFLELRGDDPKERGILNWGRRMEQLIGYRLYDMANCVQYPDGLFSKQEGFGFRGMEVEETYIYEDVRKHIWRQPGFTALKEFHAVYHRKDIKDNVPDYRFLHASARSLTSITIDVDIRGARAEYRPDDGTADEPTDPPIHYCTFFTSPKNFPNLQALDIGLDSVCSEIFDLSHPCLRKIHIKSTLSRCLSNINTNSYENSRFYKHLEQALSLSVAARESIHLLPADLDLELHLWDVKQHRFGDVDVSTLVLRPLEHKVSWYVQECSRRNRGFSELQTELTWDNEGSFASVMAERLQELDLERWDPDGVHHGRYMDEDGDWVSWVRALWERPRDYL
ncbi:hypothetical protein K440DRAFT_631352 [Wilcoxina mikolae CBS 423.85]|nr:hypothetical protein K440DRAFT_631352 [Wilcoxina mikolae CBS 423.85]